MEKTAYLEALEASTVHRDTKVTPVTTGLINRTYQVTVISSGFKFLLQEINSEVFTEPEMVQANYETIWLQLRLEQSSRSGPDLVKIPEPLQFLDGSRLFYDRHERYWRIFEFIDKAHAVPLVQSSWEAQKAAQAFANLTTGFGSFDPKRLFVTIPGFHDLSLRYRQMLYSLKSHNYERLQKAAPLIKELKSRERYVSFYEVMTGSEEFIQRVMHHDAKISNVLFDDETEKVTAVVDLDTCMAGYFFSDLGDMIRSMVCREDENSLRFDEISIRKDFYEAILSGYLNILGDQLTGAEKKYIHYAGLLLIYMQALRFMSDYLAGDMYYRINYPEHNFDRAKNQLILLQKLEEFLQEHYQLRH